MLWEALTKQVAWQGKGSVEIMNAVLTHGIDPPSDIAPDVDPVGMLSNLHAHLQNIALSWRAIELKLSKLRNTVVPNRVSVSCIVGD
jgi:hypothetical protein